MPDFWKTHDSRGRPLSRAEIAFRADLDAIVQASIANLSVRIREILAPLKKKRTHAL